MLFQKVVSEATTDSLGAPHASLPQRVELHMLPCRSGWGSTCFLAAAGGAPHASLPQRVGATSLAAVDELGHADSGAGLK